MRPVIVISNEAYNQKLFFCMINYMQDVLIVIDLKIISCNNYRYLVHQFKIRKQLYALINYYKRL
jgi:hypothetical protein